jgi:hypothetical protein
MLFQIEKEEITLFRVCAKITGNSQCFLKTTIERIIPTRKVCRNQIIGKIIGKPVTGPEKIYLKCPNPKKKDGNITADILLT